MKIFIIIITSIFILIGIFAPIEYLIKFTSDDSYFYLKTALNISKGLGSTFDGINPTNGYHPLFVIVLYPVFKVSNFLGIHSEESLLRVVFILSSFINFITLLVLKKIYFQNEQLKEYFFITTLMIIPLSLYYLIGLETQIFITILVLILYQLQKNFNDVSNKEYLFSLSIYFALLFLSRIDIFWYILLSLTIFIFFHKKEVLIKYLQSLLLPFMVVIIYLLVNKFFFGDYFPITGKYKLSFDINNNLKFFPTPLKNPIDFMLMSFIITSGIVFFLTKNKSQPIFIILIKYIYLSVFIFLLVNILLNYQGLREWYYVYALFPSTILFSYSLKNQKIKYVFTITLIVINIIYFLVFRNNYYNHTSAYLYAKRIKEITKETETIYQVDYSGIVSFFSSRKIINGDGLINSNEYFNFIKKGELETYLSRVNPDYLSFYSFNKVIDNDTIVYKFNLFNNYLIEESTKNIVVKSQLLHGGLFRKKYGNFYLVKKDDWNIERY